jgi:FkbM family methyltransferase
MLATDLIFKTEKLFKTLSSFSEALFNFKKEFTDSKRIYIFGNGLLGNQLLNALRHDGVEVTGFIDNDINKSKQMFNKTPCFLPNQILEYRDSAFIIIAVSDSIEIIKDQLLSLGFNNSYIFFDRSHRHKLGQDIQNYITNCFISALAWKDKCKLKEIIFRDSETINKFYNKLEDKLSQDIFIHRIALAINGERYGPLTYFLNKYSDTVVENRLKFNNSIYLTPRPEFQYYFNQDFFQLDQNEIYVDVGAEDGNTIVPFINRMYDLKLKYSKIYAFEPDPSSFKLLYERLSSVNDLTLHEIGLSDSEGEVGFQPSSTILGSRKCGSFGSESSNFSVQTTTLDKFFKSQPYTFVKIDPSGEAIFKILKGGSVTINKYKPKIIAGAYHEIENFYRIPLLILDICPDYKIYLRHLAFHANETHVFCLPQ